MIIKDCIYRFVEFDEICEAFINTPEFQRLRNIKQLGFVHFVYPSAVHTRFEHSLGVAHLGATLVKHLRRFVEISPEEELCVTLGGLYHDTGHAPFSHFLEPMAEIPHEKRSVIAIQNANKRLKLLSEEQVSIIADMILGNIRDPKRAFLYQIINNHAGVDVDRLDYLSRDAYHCGLPSFQSDYIIKCARVDRNTSKLIWLPKAEIEISRMNDTREYMFKTVYRHRAVLRVEAIIRKALEDHKIPVDLLEDDDADVMCRLKKKAPDALMQIYLRD